MCNKKTVLLDIDNDEQITQFAFPSRSRWDGGQEQYDLNTEGMTLRDYFAAKAINTILVQGMSSHSERARECYEIADAMLEERAKYE